MRNDVSNQIRFAGALATGNNRGLADVRMPAQRRFDFAGLDTIAADLNLTIRAAAVLDVTVRQITSEIAGAIKSIGLIVRKGIRDEALARKLLVAEVSTREMRTAKIDFAQLADATQLSRL